MSESISQLPLATQANATDLIPATQGSIGPGTGTTRAVTQAQIIAAGGTVTSNITLDAGGGWSSNNVGKQLLVTTPAAASNPGIGITDSNGANLWGVWNHAGVLTMSVMPAYSDDVTGPANVAALSSAGMAVTGTLSSSGALTVTSGGATVTAGGLTVSAGGAAITGNSTVTGTLIVNPSAGAPVGVFAGNGSTFISLGTSSAHPLLAVTSNIERARLDPNGNLLFATTNVSPVTSSVTGLSFIQSPGASAIAQISNPAGAVLALGTFSSGAQVIPMYFDGVLVGSVSMVGAGISVAYNTSSDYRIKTVYGAADTGTLIDAVPVHDAAFKAAPTERRPMFLAHELQVAVPTAVRGDKDAVDENGGIIPQLVDHSSLVPTLWAEVQSLRRRVAALEPKV